MATVLPPYYHPTTVCFIDDNFPFLRSIGMDLPDDLSFMSFLHPEEALAVVNQPEALPPLADRCFTMDNSDPSCPMISLDLGALEQEITHAERFKRISVLLVDYAMPTMSGLEFCEQVVNKNIKKALLTGVADEKTAVDAFNRGIIDSYIPKASLTTMRGVVAQIEALKQAYFAQYSSRLYVNLALNPPGFLADPGLKPWFEDLLARHRIVEYYLAADPYGYVMLRADGSMLRLVVLSPQELAAQAEFAERAGAPAAVVADLHAGRRVAYFAELPHDYLGHEAYPWAEAMLDAARVEARQTWYAGVMPDPPADIDFDPSVSSFDQFLATEKPQV